MTDREALISQLFLFDEGPFKDYGERTDAILALLRERGWRDKEEVDRAIKEQDKLDASKTITDQKTIVTDHSFKPSNSNPDACSFIVEGDVWTTADPVRCRRPRSEHMCLRRNK